MNQTEIKMKIKLFEIITGMSNYVYKEENNCTIKTVSFCNPTKSVLTDDDENNGCDNFK